MTLHFRIEWDLVLHFLCVLFEGCDVNGHKYTVFRNEARLMISNSLASDGKGTIFKFKFAHLYIVV